MATAAQLKRLRRKYGLGEFSKKRRGRRAYTKLKKVRRRKSKTIKKPDMNDTTDAGLERIAKYYRSVRRQNKYRSLHPYGL